MNKETRNSSIEILRIAFMFFILTIHVYGHGSALNYDWIYSLGSEWTSAWNLSLYSFGKIGVTGFIFISGFFGIKTNKRSLIQILSIPFFYALILSLYFGHYHIHDTINLVFAFNGWWFVSCYVFIMFMAPFIEEGIKKLGQKQFLLMLTGMFLYTYVMRFLYKDNSHDIILLLTVYMGARYLQLYPESRVSLLMRLGGVLGFAMILGLPVMIELIGWKAEKINAYFLQNNNILLFIVSYWLIYQCENLAFYNKVVNRLATSSLAIYLITDYPDVRNLLDPWLLPYLLKGYGLLMIGGICFGILCIDQVRGFLFKLIGKYLYRN